MNAPRTLGEGASVPPENEERFCRRADPYPRESGHVQRFFDDFFQCILYLSQALSHLSHSMYHILSRVPEQVGTYLFILSVSYTAVADIIRRHSRGLARGSLCPTRHPAHISTAPHAVRHRKKQTLGPFPKTLVAHTFLAILGSHFVLLAILLTHAAFHIGEMLMRHIHVFVLVYGCSLACTTARDCLYRTRFLQAPVLHVLFHFILRFATLGLASAFSATQLLHGFFSGISWFAASCSSSLSIPPGLSFFGVRVFL